VRILFATSGAPAKSPFSTAEKRPPLGVGTLMAQTRESGHTVFFVDNYLRPSSFIEDGFLTRERVDLVGIHANTICFGDTKRMLSAIQRLRDEKRWNGRLVVGGPHTAVALETIPEYVDHVVVGEGEEAFQRILNGNAKERILHGERLTNLDRLPFQPWDIFTALPYEDRCPWMAERPVFTLNTSRGCPFRCTFCSVGSVWGRGYTFMGAERILDEITFLMERFRLEGVYFREDNFTLNRPRVHAFCEGIRKMPTKLAWACESRVNTLCDEELVDEIARSGCRAVYLGVESGSQNILNTLCKDITVDQIERSIRLCRAHGIQVYCSLVAGLPGETPHDYLRTESLMRRLLPHTYSYNVFVGIPRSTLYAQLEKPGASEYRDEVGLLYPPGFDVRSRFFYGKPAEELVDAEFKLRTPMDLFLLREMERQAAHPRVSVVMAVHNGERYLKEAINSILTQDFSDLELVVIDDASTDATPEILEECQRRDSRVLIHRNPTRLGVTSSLNLGLVLAHGEYIARQDADDISLPGRLTRQVAFMDANPETALLASAFQISDCTGTVTGTLDRTVHPEAIPWLLLFYNHVSGHSTVMMRATAVRAAGLYNEQRTYAQDHDLWLRIAHHGSLVILPDVMLRWRQHDSGISAGHKEEQDGHSLQVSLECLSGYLGRPLNRKEVADLRAFWLQLGTFPGLRKSLDRTLRRLVWRFTCARPGRRNKLRSYRAACNATSQRWCEWALHEKDLKGWWSAIPDLGRSFAWSPSRCVTFLFSKAFASLRRRCRIGGR
jgi:radical SAM superfamily enzyme YgiQ (UPF0313 family)/glycosyltransferase involved in cell wall biosynthesis